MTRHPAVFLDRDGVIIENRADYVRAWRHVDIYPQALAALARIRDSHYKIVIVTNQSAVGRGLISPGTAASINARLVDEIERAGGRIDAVYMCPHAPDESCTCYKPQPGLLLQAAEALAIDLNRSIMIGDALTDVEAGLAVGIPKVALVLTGRGAEQARLPEASRIQSLRVFDTLAAALDVLIPDQKQ